MEYFIEKREENGVSKYYYFEKEDGKKMNEILSSIYEDKNGIWIILPKEKNYNHSGRDCLSLKKFERESVNGIYEIPFKSQEEKRKFGNSSKEKNSQREEDLLNLLKDISKGNINPKDVNSILELKEIENEIQSINDRLNKIEKGKIYWNEKLNELISHKSEIENDLSKDKSKKDKKSK